MVKAVTWVIKVANLVSKVKTKVAAWVASRVQAKLVEAAAAVGARTETKTSNPAAASKIRVEAARATVNDCSYLTCKQRPEQMLWTLFFYWHFRVTAHLFKDFYVT
ncbi:hypothetical protein [Flavisolibacter nicotianae]|uniref:hypothetical protein n=1 Tax=Flavisolibacter nicotianae TaxID=2364882 RepID=UPI000EB3B508|nr:hypothetical protein [Flavisolibacter nicotianae]